MANPLVVCAGLEEDIAFCPVRSGKNQAGLLGSRQRENVASDLGPGCALSQGSRIDKVNKIRKLGLRHLGLRQTGVGMSTGNDIPGRETSLVNSTDIVRGDSVERRQIK
jgi:hypothetical protein